MRLISLLKEERWRWGIPLSIIASLLMVLVICYGVMLGFIIFIGLLKKLFT